MAFLPHKLTIIGNKKDDTIGITEQSHSGSNVVAHYILGHTKKTTGVPTDEEFNKSNNLNLTSGGY